MTHVLSYLALALACAVTTPGCLVVFAQFRRRMYVEYKRHLHPALVEQQRGGTHPGIIAEAMFMRDVEDLRIMMEGYGNCVGEVRWPERSDYYQAQSLLNSFLRKYC